MDEDPDVLADEPPLVVDEAEPLDELPEVEAALEPEEEEPLEAVDEAPDEEAVVLVAVLRSGTLVSCACAIGKDARVSSKSPAAAALRRVCRAIVSYGILLFFLPWPLCDEAKSGEDCLPVFSMYVVRTLKI